MSTISVLMSVYHQDKPTQLERALQSVWDDQTLKPNQIVLVKDGPLGEGLDRVVDDWQKRLPEVMTVLTNEENLGLTKSLNKGIKAATGDYIARMDADDISLPRRFELQLAFMDSHPEISVLGGGMQEFDNRNKLGAIRIYPEYQDSIKNYIVKANPIAHPTAFIRRSVLMEGCSYDEKYRKNQDLKLWFDLLSQNHILHNLPDIVLNFRRTSDTYSKRSSQISLKSELEIYQKGITELYGKFSFKRFFPILRYIVKSMPPGLIKFVYKYLFKKNNQ